MYYNRQRRKLRLQLGAFCAVISLLLIICAAVAVKAASPSVSGTVVDGEQEYHVQAVRNRPEEMIDLAVRQGMPTLGPLDETEFDEEAATVMLRRQVEFFVNDGGETLSLAACRGKTVEEALRDNGIALKAEDLVSPERQMVIAAALTVEIKRCCRVSITADGRTQELELFGGTVEDALKQAGVKMTEDMECNYGPAELLADGMSLEVVKLIAVNIVVDGKSERRRLSAADVGEALEQCGITLGKDDRLTPDKDRPLRSGMKITVQRVKVAEETETEEIAYGTQYVSSRDLPEGQTQRLSAGLKGEKELTYRAVYVDGKEESRELLSETVKAEPVKEIILRGIGYQTTAPELNFIDDGTGYTSSSSASSSSNSGGGGKPSVTVSAEEGVLTDPWGNEYPFTKTITGTCTAYCIPGGTTSIGMKAERGVVAVDPDIIPYGTRMYVASPDGKIVYGYGVAGDTGGACMAGDIIADLCYDTVEECSIIGRREMVLYILQ